MVKLSKRCILLYIILFIFGYLLINLFVLYDIFPTVNNHDTRRHGHEEELNWTDEMKLFCSKVQHRIENENSNSLFQILQPNFINSSRQQSIEIPYHYSNWRSSSDLPRRLTPCDHQLYMELLSYLDHLFRQHHISYMMMVGTLLGSYTHHDIMPWDDDVDLRVSLRDRSRIYNLVHQEPKHILSLPNITDEFGNHDVLYFPWSPQAGAQKWSYPYVDIFYYDENFTHIWLANYDGQSINDCSINKRDVFPVVWRPFGQIWLPAPREPIIIFEFLRWTSMGKWYFAKNYSHKHERSMPFIGGRVRAHQLYPYYPWVKRYCLKTYCIEKLVTIYNKTNITTHTVQFEKYRTELFVDPNLVNRVCLF